MDSRVDGDRLLYATVSFRDGPEVAEDIFYGSMLERLKNIPGIDDVTFGNLPLVNKTMGVVEIRINGDPRRVPMTAVFLCGPDYLETVGLELLAGRGFDRNSDGVAIVSETLGRRLWGSASPVGQRFGFLPLDGEVEVIGVVPGGRYDGLRDAGGFAIFLPWKQGQLADVTGTVIARTTQQPPPGTLLPLVQREIQAFDPDLPITAVSTYGDRIGRLLQQERVGAALLTVFGLVALLVALFGVSCSVAHTAAVRMRELGIRIALGAGPAGVVKVTLSETLTYTGMGVAAGACAAAAFAKMVAPHLLDVSPYDATTYVSMTAAVLAPAACAAWIPAGRAVRSDSINRLIKTVYAE